MDFSRKVVFIDEIHSLSIKRSEILYEAVQDFKLKGIDIPKFCLIGATTYAGTIDKPLRNRFHYLIKLNYYSFEEIKDIIKINYPQFSDDVAMYIAIRSKGIPRIALSYSRIANSVSIYDNKEPSKIHVDFTMDMLNINEDGYTFDDIEVIKLLYTEGRPIGRQSICSVLGIDTTDYISNIEPVLMKSKLLIVTPRGRRITDYGIAYLRNRRYIS
jgi:Holliday junction DNA helicase RuvB